MTGHLRRCRALESSQELVELRKRVEQFAGGFAMPGFDVTVLDQAANGKATSVDGLLPISP